MLSSQWIIPGVVLALGCLALFAAVLVGVIHEALADQQDMRRREAVVWAYADIRETWVTWGREHQ